MPRDELRQPLRRRSRLERLWSKRPGALATAMLVAVSAYGGAAAWLLRHPVPFAGEPVVIAGIPPLQEMTTGSIDKPAAEPAEAEPDDTAETADAAAPPPAADVPEIQISGQQPQIIVARQRPMKAAPFAAVTETSDLGPLPRIGAGGKRPADLYAQVTPMSALTSDRPKIAILLGGMGLNARLTAKAIEKTPGDVTFGFAPYGNDLQTQVNLARNRGHEVMLQLPLEPNGYPAINPGPNTLTTDAGNDANLAALRWNLSRFAGYTGVTNYMGARFLAEAGALQPVMAELKKRGLLFLQDSTVAARPADTVARAAGLALRHGATVIDADPTPEAIAAALKSLEAQARADGVAIGTGTGLDMTIDAVSDWADSLERRGFVLVPVSAAYKGRLS